MLKTKDLFILNLSLVLIALGFVAAVLAPQHFLPIPSFYQEIGAGAGFLLAFTISVVGGLLRARWQLPWASISALIFIVLLLVGVRIHPEASLDYMLWPLGALLIAAMAAWYGHNVARQGGAERLIGVLLFSFFLAGMGTALLIWVQLFNPGGESFWLFPRQVLQAPSGNLGQRNQSALVLGFGLMALAYWGRQGVAYVVAKRALVAALMLLLVSGIALTQSRVAFGFLFVVGLCFGMLWAEPRSRFRAALLGVLGVGLAYLMLQWIIYVGLGLGQLFPPGTQRLVDRGLGQRLGMLQVAWAEFKSHPIFGGGFGSFSDWEFRLGLQQAHPLFSTNAHNIFAQIGAEFGISGLLALLVPGCISLWLISRQLWGTGLAAWPAWKVPALGVCVMLLGYSMTEFPLWYVYYLIPFALCWGVLDSTAVQWPVTRSVQVLLGLLPLIMLAFMGWASARYIDIVKLTALAADSSVYKKYQGIYQRNLQNIIVSPGFSPIVEALNFYSLSVDPFMLREKIALGERAVGNYTGAWFMQKLAYLYALNKKPNNSALTLAKACAFYPDACPEVRESLHHLQSLDPNIYDPVARIFATLPQSTLQPVNVNALKPWEHGDTGTVVTIDPKKTWFGFDLAFYASGVGKEGANGGTFVTAQSPGKAVGHGANSERQQGSAEPKP